MKKLFFIILVVALLLLDYAALDDITTGNEPSYGLEYLMLIFSSVIFLALGLFKFRHKALRKN
jgi:hypothetical protein